MRRGLSGDCAAVYDQYLLDEESRASGDREASDEIVASWSGDPGSFVPEDASDGAFALTLSDNDLVAMTLELVVAISR